LEEQQIQPIRNNEKVDNIFWVVEEEGAGFGEQKVVN
jgi:hypothetical protein